MRYRTHVHFFDKLHKNANKKLVFLDRVDSLSDNVVSRSHKMSHIQRRQTGRVERSRANIISGLSHHFYFCNSSIKTSVYLQGCLIAIHSQKRHRLAASCGFCRLPASCQQVAASLLTSSNCSKSVKI